MTSAVNTQPAAVLAPPPISAQSPISESVADTTAKTDSLAATISLATHAESPAETESDTVNIRGLRLGSKTRAFNFSVQVSGHKAPMESKALGQLAVGCKRSLVSVYDLTSKHLEKVDQRITQAEVSGTRISRALRKQQVQLREKLEVLDNIKSFDFKVRDGNKDLFPKAVLVVKGVDPITHKEITTEIVLDEEFTGEVIIAKRAINTLETELRAKEKELLELHNIRTQINELKLELKGLETVKERIDTREKIIELEAKHKEAVNDGGKERISQIETEIRRIESKIAALQDSNRHKVEVIQVREEGTTDFVPVAKVTMNVRPETQEDEDETTLEEVSMNVTDISYLIHHSGTIKTAPAIVKDIQDAAEKALKSTTDDGKAFAKKVGESRKKVTGHSAVGAGGPSSAADELQHAEVRRRMMEQMRQQQQLSRSS